MVPPLNFKSINMNYFFKAITDISEVKRLRNLKISNKRR